MDMDGLRYRNYELGDELAIIELYNLVFKKELTLDEWYWNYRDNPNQRYDIVLAFSGTTLVVQSAGIPLVFKHEGREILASRTQNVMVHPDFRKKGLFTTALRIWTEYLDEQQVDYVLTFPNDYSLPAFIRKLDYQHLADIYSFKLEIDDLDLTHIPTISVTISESLDFRQNDLDLLNSLSEHYDIYNNRTLSYLQWRYHRNSGKKYWIMRIFAGNEQIGLIIFKLYLAEMSIDLVEVIFKDNNPEVIKASLSAICDYFKDKQITAFNVWLMEHYLYYQSATEIGFQKSNLLNHVVYRSFSPRCSKNIDKLTSYYLSMGDSDVY